MRTKVPLISVVVPSYNQAQFLGPCLASIIDQGYPRLELIVMDGGSTDNSVDVIKRFSSNITYWQSERDGGQTQAIAAGFARCTGDLITWLNSDDILVGNTLQSNAEAWAENPAADVFYGDHFVIDEQGQIVERYKHPRFLPWLARRTLPYICQPGTFFSRNLYEQVGGLDPTFQCVFDYDLWMRFMQHNASFVHVGGFTAGFRIHAASKTMSWQTRFEKERQQFDARYADFRGPAWMQKGGRLALVGIQAISGNYAHTLRYRILTQHRLRAFEQRDPELVR